MSGLLNSALNESNTNLPDTTGRPFASSFSAQSASAAPVFHHPGTIQGLHNMHGSFNIPNMQGTLASRSSTVNGVPSNAVQQPMGSISNGRFTSNNIPVALSQISHGSTHGHSGITNRGGMGVSPIMGNAGPRITSSMGNVVGGGNMGRNLSSGGGLTVPGLSSRLNLTANSGSGGLSVQGPTRLISGVLQQAPQLMSMLGNSYSSGGGPLSQNQIQAGNNSLNSLGMLNDMNADNPPFDMNEFPRLSNRPNSAGGPQGQLGSIRKQGVSSLVQQNQEFSIQNEDFPALPGFKGGNNDFAMDLHQKEQLHDSMLQSQHFSMGRSGGFGLGGAYSSHRQQQQQQHVPSGSSAGGSFAHANNQDLLHLHGSDQFPSSHASYHSQNGGPPSIGLRSVNNPNSVPGIGSYDQLIQQYQQLQNQSQFRMQQMSAVNQSYREQQNLKSQQATQAPPDPFGLLGLLSVIRMSDPDLTSLALGIDLTTLGLNLNSGEDLHKKFGSPFCDEPVKGDPEYGVPECYYAKQPPVLHQGYFSKFKVQTLFYIFYSMPKDEAQLYAANELMTRGWLYHREQKIWLMRLPQMEPLVKTSTHERGTYLCFDPSTWETARKDNFVLYYDSLEKRPPLPQH